MQNGTLRPFSNNGNIDVVESIIIPKPCSPNSYYLFEVIDTGVVTPPFQLTDHTSLYYSEIDMSLNNGKGGVVPGQKNILVDSSNLVNSLSATKHANNNDYWLMSSVKDTNIYRAWQVTSTGVNPSPTVTSIGLSWIDQSGFYTISYYENADFEFSNSGEKFAVAKIFDDFNTFGGGHYTLNSSRFELLDFDKATGQLSNHVILDYDSSFAPLYISNDPNTFGDTFQYLSPAKSVEFSPNDQVLYGGTQYSLIQYDLSSQNNATIASSWNVLHKQYNVLQIFINWWNGSPTSDLELAPNGKILHNNFAANHNFNLYTIGVVNNPNVFGNGANYNFSQLSYSSPINLLLPNFIADMLQSRAITLSDTCSNMSISFSLEDTLHIDSAHWYFDTNSTYVSSSTFPVQHTYSQPGDYPVKVRYYSGCTIDSTLDTMHIMPPAEADLGPDRTLCENDTLQNALVYPGLSYQWNTGDTTSYLYNPPADTYTIEVSSPNCGTDFDTVVIDSITPFEVHLPADTLLCQGDSFLLDATVGPGSYQWSTGDTTASIYATQPDTYTVTFTNSCGSNNDTIFVDGVEEPQVDLGNDTSLCNGQVLYLDATDTLSSYQWHDGHTSPFDTTTTEGLYAVTVTNICGSDSDSLNFNIDTVLTTFSLGEDTILCKDDTLELNAPSDAQNYYWSNGQTTSSITVTEQDTYSVEVQNTCGNYFDTIAVIYDESPITNLGPDSTYCYTNLQLLDASWSRASYHWQDGSNGPTHLADTSGKYWVEVTNLCGYDDDTVKIFYDLPLDISLRPDTTLCEGESLQLSVSHHHASFEWNTGSTDSSITGYPGNTYFITATNACGTKTDTVNLLEKQVPTLELPQTDTLCKDEPIDIKISSSDNIQWFDGKSGKERTLFAPGKYPLTATNECGQRTDTIILYAEEDPSPQLGADTVICEGEEVQINIKPTFTNHTFDWNTGQESPTITAKESGLYRVTVTSPRGCEGSDEIEIADCPINIFIPNAFTPNGDGLNDKFEVQGIGITDYHILIFDRWGNLVFESNDINRSWNGLQNNSGEKVNQGTYNYKLQYRSGDYDLEERFGTIEVIY
ncbi:T9SS type B sorting domain-containing protein [Salibacter halophilus]|nr:gliding motility-associated C-terminal domain-containing protein [Salibacter halophilus]